MDAQGTQTNAKEDTVYLGLSSTPETDLSQFGVDLTSQVGGTYSATGGYHSTDSIRNLTGATGREIYVRLDPNIGDSDYSIISYADPSGGIAPMYEMRVDGDGSLSLEVGGTSYFTYEWNGFSTQEFSLTWVTRPNPDTTGASDACISQLYVYAHTDAEWDHQTQFVHPVGASASTHTFHVGGFYDSNIASWTLDSPQIVAARVGRAYHTAPENGEDWIANRAGAVYRIGGFPTYPVVADLASQNEYAGMANAGYQGLLARNIQLAAKSSPLLTETYRNPPTYQASMSTADTPAWYDYVPTLTDSAGYFDLSTLRYIRLPSMANAWGNTQPGNYSSSIDTNKPYLQIKLHVKSWATAGDPVPLTISARIANVWPGMSWPEGYNPPPNHFNGADATITVDHVVEGTAGEWVTLTIDTFQLSSQIPWEGGYFVALGWTADPDATNVASARWQLNSYNIIPRWPSQLEV